MKIGLIKTEPKIVNTALMQIACHYRNLGHTVKRAGALFYDEYDELYCSSLFDYTNKTDIPKRTICGGTGFDLTTILPLDCDYDYSIYPKCDFSIVWFSRGCIRNCPFCVVPQKEGKIYSVKPKPLNPKGIHIKIQDNNFFANPKWRKAAKKIISWDQPVVMEGLDVRLLTPPMLSFLNEVKHYKQIKIAWDNPKNKKIKPAILEMIKHIKPYKIMCYVLIGYRSTPKEDLYRVETLRNLDIDPFVMCYNKKDYYQRGFARWVNHKATFKTVEWKDYKY